MAEPIPAPTAPAGQEPPPRPNQAFEEGLEALVVNQSPGFANAFPGRMSEEGWTYTQTEFLELLNRLEILPPSRNLPETFAVNIEFSPIALFKCWIFTVSNKRFLKVTERHKEFQRDFFLFLHQDFVCFQPLTSNIAHESFLVNVFEKKQVSDYVCEFRTQFGDDRKLVVYKDYLNRKISSVEIPKGVPLRRLVKVKVALTKDSKGARFRIYIENQAPITHAIKLTRTAGSDRPEKAEKPAEKKPVAPARPAPAPVPEKVEKPKVAEKAPKIEKVAEKPVKAAKVAKVEPVKAKPVAKVAAKPAKTAASPKATKAAVSDASKSVEDYRREVQQMIAAVHNTKRKTNKFANISFGRVNKIPVLINLATKYKDLSVRFHVTKSHELVVFDPKDIEIKTFLIAKNPKSNWLEKKA